MDTEKTFDRDMNGQGGNSPDISAQTDTSDVYLDKIYNDSDDKLELEKHRKNKMTKADKRIISILSAANAAVFAFIGIFILLTNGANEYDDIKSQTSFKTASQYYKASSVFADKLEPKRKETDFPGGIKVKFANLYSANNDVAGWIKIAGSGIDFCVLQAEDNDKYLRHDFYDRYNIRGSIFMDYRNTFARDRASLSKNTIIYGHLMKADESTFTELQNYMDIEYYKKHPVIEMDTIYNNYYWKVISCFISCPDPENDGGNVFYYWYPDFTDDNTLPFANEVASRSYFINTSVDVRPTDKFLTLSTCTHLLNKNGYVNTRCVIVARLVRDGESIDVDVNAVNENPDRRMPQKYYDINGLENPYKNVSVWQAY